MSLLTHEGHSDSAFFPLRAWLFQDTAFESKPFFIAESHLTDSWCLSNLLFRSFANKHFLLSRVVLLYVGLQVIHHVHQKVALLSSFPHCLFLLQDLWFTLKSPSRQRVHTHASIVGLVVFKQAATVQLSLLFNLFLLVREREMQVCGYHGDINEPLAAALTFLLISVLFTCFILFIHPNVSLK